MLVNKDIPDVIYPATRVPKVFIKKPPPAYPELAVIITIVGSFSKLNSLSMIIFSHT